MVEQNLYSKLKPWLPSIFLIPLVIFLIMNKGKFIFIIDHVNLLFHEGGHGIFKIFGEVIYTLGGSLMQIIIPSLFILFFTYNKKRIGVQLSIVYLAQNLMNISVYVADARTRKLPLLGGNRVYHDWHYLLREFGMLQYDETLGLFIYCLGIVCLIIAFCIPLIMRDYEKIKLDLKL